LIYAIELQLRVLQLQVELHLNFSLASDVTTKDDISEPLDCFVICANSELQHELQLRCDKVSLSRLSPKHTLIFNYGMDGKSPANEGLHFGLNRSFVV
jgi:hypothetical protein